MLLTEKPCHSLVAFTICIILVIQSFRNVLSFQTSSSVLQVQADPNRIVVSGQSLAATAVGKTSFFTISNVTGSVEDVEVSVEGESHHNAKNYLANL